MRRETAFTALVTFIGAATTLGGLALGMVAISLVGPVVVGVLPDQLWIIPYVAWIVLLFLGGAAGLALGYQLAFRIRGRWR